MKKVLSILLSAVLLFACCSVAFAQDIVTNYALPFLQFDSKGDFKILHLTDVQDGYPMAPETLQFINETLDTYQPDLVVLGGDNTVGPKETKEQAIQELVKPFVDRGIFFTLVFGNHDHEQGVDDATLLTYYQRYGGRYCLAYDDIPSMSGEGTHCLPILSSDADLRPKGSTELAYVLWLFDSNDYETDAAGNEGYGCVQEDQIEWFKANTDMFKGFNGGKIVPSMAFQHIIVGEIMDTLYPTTESSSSLTKFCNGKNYLTSAPNLTKIDGQLFEVPCPGVTNYGQLDAMSEAGVVACFSGHDHVNAFRTNIKGVDIVNTAGCTFNSYGKLFNRGARLITIHEDTTDYETQNIVMTESALKSGSEIANVGSNLNIFTCVLGVVLNRIINAFLAIIQ